MKDTFRKKLTSDQQHILVDKGTELPFSGALLNNKQEGVYRCAACHSPLFSSATKFDSGSGWPSFWDAVDESKVKLVPDNSHGMERTEVQCATCGGLLGHLFDDGPTPTGQRYCINSLSLDFDGKSVD